MSIFVFTRFSKSRFGRVFLGIFALLTTGLFVLFITAPDPSSVQKKEPLITLSQEEELKKQFKEKLNEDSDGDGLREWEEAVYKTDPNKPDTDGDGLSDGDEIKQNRNPLVKGPKDRVAPPEKEEVSPLSFKFEKGNLTQEFTQKLMGDPNFMTALRNKGVGISESAISTYIDQLPADAINASAKPLDPSKLLISNDQGTPAVQKYFEQFAIIYLKNGDAFTRGDDLTIMLNALQNNNTAEFSKLGAMATAFEKIIMEANALSIPRNVVWFHQKEIVFLIKSKNELTVLKNVNTDPLAALMGLNTRLQTKQAIANLHQKELADWLSQNSVSLLPMSSLFFLNKK